MYSQVNELPEATANERLGKVDFHVAVSDASAAAVANAGTTDAAVRVGAAASETAYAADCVFVLVAHSLNDLLIIKLPTLVYFDWQFNLLISCNLLLVEYVSKWPSEISQCVTSERWQVVRLAIHFTCKSFCKTL